MAISLVAQLYSIERCTHSNLGKITNSSLTKKFRKFSLFVIKEINLRFLKNKNKKPQKIRLMTLNVCPSISEES